MAGLTSSRHPHCLSATLVIAALGLALAPSARALTEVSKTVNATGDHTATATCGAGEHIVSGGGWAQLIPASLAQPAIGSSVLAGNGWTAGGFSHASPFPYNVTAYAYCEPGNRHLRTSTATTNGTPRVSTPVTCDSGHAVSGGGAVVGAYGFPFANAKQGNGWLMGADATFDGGMIVQSTTRAEVYCSPGRFGLVRAKKSGVAAGNHILDETAPCPARTVIASGGGDAGTTGFIWYSRIEGNGWRIDANNLSPSDPTTVTAYAYCLRLPETRITRVKVKRRRRIAKVRFRGSGGEGALKFQCKLDRRKFSPCRSPKTYRHLKPGRHTFRVRSRDAAGRLDTSPAKRKFRIKLP